MLFALAIVAGGTGTMQYYAAVKRIPPSFVEERPTKLLNII